MATVVKFNTFPRDILLAIHNFNSHTFKAMLTNSAPLAANTVKADISEISAGFGYSAGGVTVPCTVSLSGATAKVTATDATITAAGGTVGPFRWVVLYNDTSSGDSLIGYIDYGSSISIASGDPFILDFDSVNGLFTAA